MEDSFFCGRFFPPPLAFQSIIFPLLFAPRGENSLQNAFEKGRHESTHVDQDPKQAKKEKNSK